MDNVYSPKQFLPPVITSASPKIENKFLRKVYTNYECSEMTCI
jgi:hypothetical protein